MRVKCLYCDLENDALETSGYCENCGKRLPNSAMIRTRKAIAAGADGERTAGFDPAGMNLAARSRIAEALFAAAVVQLACGGLFLVLGPALFHRVPETFLVTVLTWTVVPTLALALLGVGARWQPRPGVLLAVVLYAVWIAVGFLAHPDVARAWLAVHGIMVAVLGWVAWLGLRST